MVKKKITRDQKVGETVNIKHETYIREIEFRSSIGSYISTVIGLAIYFTFVVSIFSYLVKAFEQSLMYPILMLAWIYFCIRFISIIPRPVQTYTDKKVIEEFDD